MDGLLRDVQRYLVSENFVLHTQLIMQVKNNCERRKLMRVVQGMLEKVSHLIGEMSKVLIKQNYV